MPNRILKESICTSKDIDALSPEEEILFYRLLVKADDYGRYWAEPELVKSACYPLKVDKVKGKAIEQRLGALAAAGLVTLYEVEGRRYLQFPKWAKHQTVRAKTSRFPGPPESGRTDVLPDPSGSFPTKAEGRIRGANSNSNSKSKSEFEIEVENSRARSREGSSAQTEQEGKSGLKAMRELLTEMQKKGELPCK